LPVGSCGISDNRKITPVKDSLPVIKAWTQAIGINGSPTTASTVMVPVPDMSCTIKTNGGPIEIAYTLNFTMANATVGGGVGIYVDGTPISNLNNNLSVGLAGYYNASSNNFIVPVAAGTHKIDMYWSTNNGTYPVTGADRNLKVREL
jgi:hypothetical protein